MNENPASRSGVEQAAILLLTLGEQEAAQVLKHLGAKDVQRVGLAMAQLSGISRVEVTNVLSNFSTAIEEHTSLGVDADEYVRKVLVEALGNDKASSVIDRILRGRNSRGLETLKWMDPKAVAEMLRHEHPQIVSIVLSYLDADQSAEILMALPEALRADLIMRIAALESIHPSALNELDEVLEKQFTGSKGTKTSAFGGPKIAADIMNMVGGAEAKILEEIATTDEALSQSIQELMFVFENLIEVDDRGMQELLREIPGEQLILALKVADEELKAKIFKNMSERAAEMLKDDLEAKGPVRLSEVEAAQKEILLTARRLSEEGRIALGGKGAEEYV
jgi:flagellar motor switch protein FliG